MTDKERLVNEWLEHEKIVLAVDFDDTIFPWKHRGEEECMETIRLVKWCQTIGCYVVIHTASDKDRYQFILSYCHEKGIDVDSINKNPISLPYGSEGKIYYNWQLCDRSGLSYAMDVLDKAAKEVVSKKQSKIKLNSLS